MRNKLIILSVVVRVVALLLIVREVWLLIGIPAIANAVVTFFTIGAIPGTDLILTSNESYLLAVSLFALTMGVAFRRDMLKLVHHQQKVVHAHTEPKPVRRTSAVKQSVPRKPRLSVAARLIAPMQRTAELLFELGLSAAIISIRFWHLVEPYLRRFDGWLDDQFHSYKPTTAVLSTMNEIEMWFTKLKTFILKRESE